MYEYELFAVINHEGQVNTGHYTNYARFEDQVRILLPDRCMVTKRLILRVVVPLQR